MDKKIDKY